MKKQLTALTATLLLAASSHGDISWSVTGDPIEGPDDVSNRLETSFTTALQGNRFSATGGYFVQLLNAGIDGIANPIPSTVPVGFENDIRFGAQGDDTVVATRWIGAGSGTAGEFNPGNPFAADVTGQNYYVRAWAGLSQDTATVQGGAAAARLPLPQIDGTVNFWWYGDSAPILNEGDGNGAPIIRDYNFAGSAFQANNLVQTIPEPSSLALVGLGGLAIASRMRRKQA